MTKRTIEDSKSEESEIDFKMKRRISLEKKLN